MSGTNSIEAYNARVVEINDKYYDRMLELREQMAEARRKRDLAEEESWAQYLREVGDEGQWQAGNDS